MVLLCQDPHPLNSATFWLLSNNNSGDGFTLLFPELIHRISVWDDERLYSHLVSKFSHFNYNPNQSAGKYFLRIKRAF